MPKSQRIDRKLKSYARRKGIRKGSKAYNKYVYGTVSRRFAHKAHARHRFGK